MNRIHYAIVFVSDMKRSIEFYRDLLGFKLKFESIHWAEFETEGTTLALHPSRSEGASGGADARSAPGSCNLGFLVNDLEAFHQKMLARNVPCIQPPKREDLGGVLAIYADPDGLPFSVGESKS